MAAILTHAFFGKIIRFSPPILSMKPELPLLLSLGVMILVACDRSQESPPEKTSPAASPVPEAKPAPEAEERPILSTDSPTAAEIAAADPRRAKIEAKVRAIVAEQLGVDAAKIGPEARFLQDLGADSLDGVELIMAFEEEFNLSINDERAVKIATVGDAVRTLISLGAR